MSPGSPGGPQSLLGSVGSTMGKEKAVGNEGGTGTSSGLPDID